MADTKKLIVEASNLPLSIIIVGVGSAEFDQMEELDADKKALTDNQGRKATRDIVQFVPFREVSGNSKHLAKKVLREIPRQMLGFFTSHNISPFPKKQLIVNTDKVWDSSVTSDYAEYGLTKNVPAF